MARASKAALNSESVHRLERLGISQDDAVNIRAISMTLHRWAELECGFDHGCIERDETTGKPYWLSSRTGKRSGPIPDRETGALKRLARILTAYPGLSCYHQTDPRGAALYILRPGDVPAGESMGSWYTRGIPVCD